MDLGGDSFFKDAGTHRLKLLIGTMLDFAFTSGMDNHGALLRLMCSVIQYRDKCFDHVIKSVYIIIKDNNGAFQYIYQIQLI